MRPIHTLADGGVRLNVLGIPMAVRLHGRDTGGGVSVVESHDLPGGGPPLHVHRREDEVFQVLEGEYEWTVGGNTFTAQKGATIFAPRDVPHTYRYLGQTPGRLMCVITPAGFEEFFEKVAALSPQEQQDIPRSLDWKSCRHRPESSSPRLIMESKAFKSAAAFRRWLEMNHSRHTELWVLFYRKDSGRGGLTYPEAVEEALCFGWIDGVRKRLDEQSYVQRFTPRRPRSNWSNINIQHVARLEKAGRMAPAGLEAYAARAVERSGVYSFENAPRELDAADEKQFRANTSAWTFFQTQPPGYRRLALWWVTSARKPETRTRRLGLLTEHSANGRRVGPAAKAKVASRAQGQPPNPG